MSKLSANYIIRYVLFFWGVAWRTLTLSLMTAVLTSIGLAIFVYVKGLPPTFIDTVAPLLGLPITLLVITYVIGKQSVRLIRNEQTTDA